MKLRSIILGLLLALASPLAAFAQCSGQAPATTYCGNPTGALALPGWKPFSGLPFPSIAGGTVVGNRTTGSATASAITNPILGIPGTSTGQLGLAGATSGTVTILPQAAAGTYNFNLPTGAGTSGQPLLSGGGGSSPMTFGTLAVPAGGTGLTSGTSGGVPYFSASTTMASSAALAANQIVLGGGAGAAPATLGSLGTTTTVLHGNAAGAPTFGAVSLTADVSGILPEANGGTNQSTYTLGDILYASAPNTLSKLAGNITTAKQYLSQTGSGAASAAPAWATIAGGDITGAALTKTDDTNVTLTLGGTPTTALLRAASLTLGWTGQLALTRGGTNASLTASTGGIVYSGASALAILSGTATANQVLLSGSSAAPAWSTATYPATTTVNQLLYSSSANVIAGLATANGGVLNTSGAGVPSITPTPTLGVAGGTGGQITLNGATSGSAVIKVAAAAGTTNFQLPVGNGTSGYLLQTDGSGNTSWVVAGGTGTVTSVVCGGVTITTTGTCPPIYDFANCSLAASAGSSALTIALKDNAGSDPSSTSPCVINFRNATNATGSWSQVAVTAATSLVVSSGSTLGVTSSKAFRLWVVGFNDGGTFRLGVINLATSSNFYPLNASIVQSSTAEGGAGAADSAGVYYTGTAVTSKALVILGYLEWSSSGLTAGTWTTTNLLAIVTMGPGIKKPGDIVQSVLSSGGGSTRACALSAADVANTTIALTPTSAANAIYVHYSGEALASAGGAGTNTEITYRIAVGGSAATGTPSITIGNVSAAGTNQQSDGPLAISLMLFPNSTSSQSHTLQSYGINTSGNCNTNNVNGRADEIMR